MDQKNILTIDNPDGSGKIALIGTKHYSEQSTETVNTYLQENAPDRLFVEASERDLEVVKSGSKLRAIYGILKMIKTYPKLSLALLQSQLSQKENDGESKAMIDYAEEHNIPIEATDISKIELMRKLKQSDFTNSSTDLDYVTFTAEYTADPEEVMESPLDYSPEAVSHADKLTSPDEYREIMIEDRNEHMATVLASALREHPDEHMVFTVGYGHLYGVYETLVDELGVDTGGGSAALSS